MEASAPKEKLPVPMEEFMKLELRVAEIESVTPHPNADRLYVLGIRVGDTKKQIVAGVRKHYGEAELMGKKIIVVNNLAPAVIRGVESQGMLLAASIGDTLSLVTPERPMDHGAQVK